MKSNHKLLLTIFTICLVTSTILAFTPTDKICGEDETSSCSIVQNSEYKETLGIKNSYSGIFIFTMLILITASQIKNPTQNKKTAITFLVTIAALGAFYFIYIQAFIIKAFCLYCMVVDIGSILALIIIIATKNKTK